MPYFKDTESKLHFLDDASFVYLLPVGSVEITDGEAAQLNVTITEDVKNKIINAIKNKRDDLRFNGGVKVGDNWFLSNQSAAMEYNSILNLGVSNATVIRSNWRTMNGTTVAMTTSLAKQIIASGFQQAAAIDDAAQAHILAVEASSDPENYDFTNGWPDTYL